MKTVQADAYLRPVIPLLVCLILGIVAGVKLPGHEIPAGLILFACMALLVWGVRRQRDARILPLFLFLGLGYLSIQPWIHPRFPADHVVRFIGGRQWQVTGIVYGPPVSNRHYLNFVVAVQGLADETGRRSASGKVRVSYDGEAPEMATGDAVTFSARLLPIRNFNNPGGFDYRRFLAFQGVFARGYIVKGSLRVAPRPEGNPIPRLIDRTRQRLLAFIKATASPGTGDILGALVVGNLSPIPPMERETFNRAGVGHLLAISGLHIGMVALFFGFLFTRLYRRVNFLLWRGWVRRAAVLSSFVPVMMYGALSGMPPATQRSVIMAALFLTALIIGRRQDGVNVLAVAALLILLFHPPVLYSISFQLSFAAVGTIVYGLSKTGIGRAAGGRSRMRVQDRVSLFFTVSLLAIFGTLPLAMYHFNQISLIALLANCLAVPAIGCIVVPAALLAVLLYPVSLTPAGWCMAISANVLEQSLKCIRLLADLPFASIHTVTPNFVEILGYYLLGGAVLNLVGRLRNPDPMAGRRDLKRPVLQMALAALILLVDGGYWTCHRFRRKELQVTFLDVGAGNAALLELPGGHIMLIDGGGFADNEAFDVGRRIVAPFLWQQKIRTIDTLVLTHADCDHLNGLLYIVRHFTVKEIWYNGQAVFTDAYGHFREAVRLERIPMPAFRFIRKERQIHGVRMELLHPSAGFPAVSQNGSEVNNNSIVLRVGYGAIGILFPGDIMASAERELVESKGSRINSTIMLAPHHGSKTSSTQVFLETVHPEVVVVSCRARGRARLPHSKVAERYRRLGIRILATDLHGALTMVTDGKGYSIAPTVRDHATPLAR